ncbi:hypothetical protein VTH06DRAFT_250 [Thermothelomyces fergusii]
MDKVDPSMFPSDGDQDNIENSIGNYYCSCTEVTPTCPVSATTLGYFPNREINIFFTIGWVHDLASLLISSSRKGEPRKV